MDKEKLLEILVELDYGKITSTEAQRQILSLFNMKESALLFCNCENRQDQYQIKGAWICGDCEMEIKQRSK